MWKKERAEERKWKYIKDYIVLSSILFVLQETSIYREAMSDGQITLD
jgi:hypothetical protein